MQKHPSCSKKKGKLKLIFHLVQYETHKMETFKTKNPSIAFLWVTLTKKPSQKYNSLKSSLFYSFLIFLLILILLYNKKIRRKLWKFPHYHNDDAISNKTFLTPQANFSIGSYSIISATSNHIRHQFIRPIFYYFSADISNFIFIISCCCCCFVRHSPDFLALFVFYFILFASFLCSPFDDSLNEKSLES